MEAQYSKIILGNPTEVQYDKIILGIQWRWSMIRLF
jgi:hypothetical protein